MLFKENIKFGIARLVFENPPESPPPAPAAAPSPNPPEDSATPPDRQKQVQDQIEAREQGRIEAEGETLRAAMNLDLANFDETVRNRFLQNLDGLNQDLKNQLDTWQKKFNIQLATQSSPEGLFTAEAIISLAEKWAAVFKKQEGGLINIPDVIDDLIKRGGLPALSQEAKDSLAHLFEEYFENAKRIVERANQEQRLITMLTNEERPFFDQGIIRVEDNGALSIDETNLQHIPETKRNELRTKLTALKTKFEAKPSQNETPFEAGSKLALWTATLMKFFESFMKWINQLIAGFTKAMPKDKEGTQAQGATGTAQAPGETTAGSPTETPEQKTTKFLQEQIPGFTNDELAYLEKASAQQIAQGKLAKPADFVQERFEQAIALLKKNKAHELTDSSVTVAAFLQKKFEENQMPLSLKEGTREVASNQGEYPDLETIRGRLKSHDTTISIHPGGTLVASPDRNKAVLTFDICSPYKEKTLQKVLESLALIEQKKEFPVILFVTGIALKSPEIRAALERLKTLPHVSIQAHGLEHKPCTSQHTAPIYKQTPTGSLEAAYREIVEGAKAIQALTGKKPRYFRSATRYSDPVVEEMVRALGMEMVSQTRGTDDGGSRDTTGGQIRKGSIYLGHAKNLEGVRGIYDRLEKERIPTVALA